MRHTEREGRTWAARLRAAGLKMERQDGRDLGACVPYSDRELRRRCARRYGIAAAHELRAYCRSSTYLELLEGARAQGRLAAATPIMVRPETDAEARARTKRWRKEAQA
jgi:hypothetical protein